jgi:hypothetical protein
MGAISYAVHRFLEHERDIGRNEVRAEYAVKLADAKEVAAIQLKEMTAQRDTAISKGTEREQTLRAVSASAAAASVSLRDTLESIRNGVPTATIEALRNSTGTLTTVLTECQGRYRDLAEKADRHASDAKTLSDAWPIEPKSQP